MIVDITVDLIHKTRKVKEVIKASWRKCLTFWLFTFVWNAVAVCMVLLFTLYYVIWLAGRPNLSDDDIESIKTGSTHHYKAYTTVLLSFGFLTGGFFLAFVYALSYLSINPYVGPLLHALVLMVKDVLKFFFFFSIIFLAFSFSFKKLYLQYSQGTARFSDASLLNKTTSDQVQDLPLAK